MIVGLAIHFAARRSADYAAFVIRDAREFVFSIDVAGLRRL